MFGEEQLGVRDPYGQVGRGGRDAGDAEPIKICSEEFVKKLVTRALPGLTLTHVPVPPRAIAAQVETQYFMVNRQGPCWDHMVATRRVGVSCAGRVRGIPRR